jgi:hypothetical protein
MHIIVKRGAGTSPGDEIVDTLLATVPVALSRGRAELDKQGSGAQDVTLTVPFLAGRRLGQIEAVHDILAGRTYLGKITSLRHHGQGGDAPEAWTDLTLEMPSKLFV